MFRFPQLRQLLPRPAAPILPLAIPRHRAYTDHVMPPHARASVPLSPPLAARVEAESVRRGVPVVDLVDEALAAYLDEEPTDERLIAVGAGLAPEAPYRPISAAAAEAIVAIMANPPAPTPALRKLLRGL